MKNLFNYALLAVSTLIFSSCTKDALRGSGEITTEVRTLQHFDIINLDGIREADIIKSTESKVEMTGYANLLQAFEARVSAGNLHFGYPAFSNIRNDNIKLKIYTPQVVKVNQSGETKVRIGAGFAWDVLDVYLSGRSHFEVAGGTANNLRIDGSGISKVFTRQLLAKNAEVRLSGLSQVEVNVTEYLYADASGGSRIRYWGAPTAVDIRTSGDARVIRQ